MKLTDEQTQFFSAMESMFNSAGWKLLSQGWRQEQQMLPESAFFNAKTETDLQEDRVRYRLISELLSLPEEIARQKAALEEAPEDDE